MPLPLKRKQQQNDVANDKSCSGMNGVGAVLFKVTCLYLIVRNGITFTKSKSAFQQLILFKQSFLKEKKKRYEVQS